MLTKLIWHDVTTINLKNFKCFICISLGFAFSFGCSGDGGANPSSSPLITATKILFEAQVDITDTQLLGQTDTATYTHTPRPTTTPPAPTATSTYTPIPTHTHTPTQPPSPTPNREIINGLVLQNSSNYKYLLVKNGQPEPLSYEDILRLGSNSHRVGFAIDQQERVFSLEQSIAGGFPDLYVEDRDSKELFFDDQDYVVTKVYGIIDDFLISSLVKREPPPGQDFGDLAAIALDGSEFRFLGVETDLALISPDQNYVIYNEKNVVKKWHPGRDTVETVPISPYYLGSISPDGAYIAVAHQENRQLNIYDLNDQSLVISGQIGPYSGRENLIWNRNGDRVVYFDPFRNGADAWFTSALFLDGRTESYKDLFSPAFSPDGKRMVASFVGVDQPSLVVVELDTDERIPIDLSLSRFSSAIPVYWIDLEAEE